MYDKSYIPLIGAAPETMIRRRTNILKKDKKGALEGLPLYLIILVVIAGVGTAVLVGWMMSAQSTELDSIELDRNTMTTSQRTVSVTAYDQNGNTLEGVTVTLEGCGVIEAGTTDSNGVAQFSNLSLNLPSGQNFGTIDVTARYTGSITTTRNAVITVTS